MSDRHEREGRERPEERPEPPVADDPFLAGDPAARERETRRMERERRRRERQAGRAAKRDRSDGEERRAASRRSLGKRVGEALSGAADRGREAVERRRRGAEGEAAAPQPREPEVQRAEPEPSEPGRPARPARAGQEAIRRRRLVAGAAVLAVIAALALILTLAGGGEEAPVETLPELATFSLTIPEGQTRDQIAELAADAGLRGNYRRATRNPPSGFNLRRYGAEDAPSLEGFLFPATYELEDGARVQDLVDRQLEAFEQNLAEVNLRPAERRNLDVYDLLKIASMIEREVSVDRERRLASAVIHNRLSAGMALGIDATLRYELDNFERPLRESELQADTPYNTRINPGLPPTPIGNPGLASIEAAADPADRDFLYYVVEPGTCNEHVFTADEDHFFRAQAEYQEALEREGGSPTEC